MLSYSCEKEPLSASSASAEEQIALIEAVNVQVDGPAPAYQSITEIPADLRDGVLHFNDVMEIRRTLNTFAITSDEDYRTWAVGIGFDSPYLQYLGLREQLETDQAPLKPSALNDEQEKFLFIDQDGVPRFKLPYFELMKITNLEDGTFEAGSTINYYTPDHHFVIPDNQYDVLAMIQNNPFADYSEEGVIVEGIEIQRSHKPTTSDEKVERANLPCPIGLSDGPSTTTVSVVMRELTDERTIGGQRQRLISKLVFINSIMLVAGNGRQVLQRMSVEYDNEKRSWFTWIGTQPGTSFAQAVDFNTPTPNSAGPVNDDITITRNLRVFRNFDGTPLGGFFTLLDYDGPISEVNTSTFTVERDDSRGSGVFDDSSFSYTQPAGVTESDFDLSYLMSNGSARVFWSGRDTNNGNDHVSGDFNCN